MEILLKNYRFIIESFSGVYRILHTRIIYKYIIL